MARRKTKKKSKLRMSIFRKKKKTVKKTIKKKIRKKTRKTIKKKLKKRIKVKRKKLVKKKVVRKKIKKKRKIKPKRKVKKKIAKKPKVIKKKKAKPVKKKKARLVAEGGPPTMHEKFITEVEVPKPEEAPPAEIPTGVIKFKIENIVASANLAVELDLYAIAREVDNVEYEPEQFPGAILKLKDPKTSLLLFKNGKLICTGAKSKGDVDRSIHKAYEAIKHCIRKEPSIKKESKTKS